MPRQHYEIYKDDKKIGYVTSGNFSPSVNSFIGLGYVNVPFHKSGTDISIDIRGSRKTAIVVKPPFYKDASHK
jgi:aminomethyltransferase